MTEHTNFFVAHNRCYMFVRNLGQSHFFLWKSCTRLSLLSEYWLQASGSAQIRHAEAVQNEYKSEAYAMVENRRLLERMLPKWMLNSSRLAWSTSVNAAPFLFTAWTKDICWLQEILDPVLCWNLWFYNTKGPSQKLILGRRNHGFSISTCSEYLTIPSSGNASRPFKSFYRHFRWNSMSDRISNAFDLYVRWSESEDKVHLNDGHMAARDIRNGAGKNTRYMGLTQSRQWISRLMTSVLFQKSRHTASRNCDD